MCCASGCCVSFGEGVSEAVVRCIRLCRFTGRWWADLETPVSAFLRIAAEEPEGFSAGVGRGRGAGGEIYVYRGWNRIRGWCRGGGAIVVEEGKKRREFDGGYF